MITELECLCVCIPGIARAAHGIVMTCHYLFIQQTIYSVMQNAIGKATNGGDGKGGGWCCCCCCTMLFKKYKNITNMFNASFDEYQLGKPTSQ